MRANHYVAFNTQDCILEGLDMIAAAMEQKNGQRVTRSVMAKRIVQSTVLAWMHQVERGALDLDDPKWRPC